MKIVIEISDQKYKWIVDNPQTYTDEVHDAIRNGTPLPEHHGRLIDECQIVIPYDICDGEEAMEFVHDAPTIIEADTEGSDTE